MCGRFFLWLEDERTRNIVFPTDDIMALTREGWKTLRWGMRVNGKPVINARSETVSIKPMFYASFRQRRCLVPADGFFEWVRLEGKRTKNCYQVTDADSARMMMAGIYNEKDECAIITQTADDIVGTIHDRMPVFLQSSEMQALWLHQDDLAEIVLSASQKNALKIKPETEDITPKRKTQSKADRQMALDID